MWLLFRKMLYSIFDPAIWCVPLFASLICLSWFSDLKIYIIISIIAFWFGMFCINKGKIHRNMKSFHKTGILTLEIFTKLVFIIYIFSCLYVFSKNGIPLLSENPTESKIGVFEEMGILRRISFIGGIIPINLCILIFSTKKNRTYIILLLAYLSVKLLLGAKSSIIGLIFPLYYFMTQSNLNRYDVKTQIIKISKYKKYISGTLLLSIIIFVIIANKESKIEGEDPLVSIGFRLMEFGDVMLFYNLDNVQSVFTDYNLFRLIPDELNGILGMLRLSSYNEPLGFIMAQEAAGQYLDTIVGPNIPFPIKGHIYCGFVGGIIYSYVIGIIFAKIRRYFFCYRIRNLYTYSIIAFIFFNLMGLIRQSEAFISLIFDYFFYTIPLLLISQILVKYYSRSNYISQYKFIS